MKLLHDIVADAAVTAPDRIAVLTDVRAADAAASWTFAEFDRRIRCAASWFATHLPPGETVAVIADNSADYAVLYYAVPRSGRVLTLINQRLNPAEQAAQLDVARPALILGDAKYLNVLPDGVGLRMTLTSPPWHAAMTENSACTESVHPDDPAWALFTSGSTGVPKHVVHSHRSILAAVRGGIEGRSVPPAGVYLLPFPLCHIAGYNMVIHHAVAATVVLTSRFRPDSFVSLVNSHAVTSCSLAPTMLHALLAHLTDTGTDLPTLRSVAYGSAAIPLDLLRRAIDVLGVDFQQGYGMTETAGNVTFLGPDEHRAGARGATAILGGAGRPHSGVEIDIVDAAGRPLPIGTVGEIVVRGAQVMPGAEEWLRTGDVGRLDDDGRLYVVDRLKDVIVTGGENVSSREIEDVLSTHPDVDMVAVVGVPDDYWGESVCAVVVPAPGSQPDPRALIDHVRAGCADFKRPRTVLFVADLPMTSNGKVAKNRVRDYARSTVADRPRNR